MRVVLDTNIWISSLLNPASSAGKIIKKWEQGKFDIVTSKFILEEIERVIKYSKIFKRLHWNEEKIKYYLGLLELFTTNVDITHVNVKVESDPDDSCVLATLIASSSDYLVTGDKDLLVLKDSYPIVSLADFYQKIA